MSEYDEELTGSMKQTLTELPAPEPGTDGQGADTTPPPITVRVSGAEEDLEFTEGFQIGRGQGCDVVVDEAGVSRRHTEVYWSEGSWRVRDLQSTNGTHLEGVRIESARLSAHNVLTLGSKGPRIQLVIDSLEAEQNGSGD